MPNQQMQQQHPSGISKTVLALAVIASLAIGFYLGFVFATVTKPAQVATPTEMAQSMPSSPPPATSPASSDPDAAKLERTALDHPDEPSHWIDLGNHYFDTQQPTLAIPAYERALQLAPDNADVTTDLGVMYRLAGQHQKALESFERAIKLNPAHEIARFNKGIVLMHDLKDSAGALKAWKDLLRLNPSATSPNGMPVATMVKELETSKPETQGKPTAQ